jgi:hypothetical protein
MPATYKPKKGEGKARSRTQAQAEAWTAEDAKKALTAEKDREALPETEDAFSPTPPHHPEGKKMAPRPPGTQSHTPPSSDLWAQAEALAEQRKAENEAVARVAPEVADEPSAQLLPSAVIDTEAVETGDLVAAAMAEAKRAVWSNIGLDPLVGSRLAQYLQNRSRVTLELQDGTFTMPVINYVTSKFSVTLIVPLDKNGTTFVPKPGTKVTLSCGEFAEEVFFPGAYAEVEPLTVAVMTFIRGAGDDED